MSDDIFDQDVRNVRKTIWFGLPVSLVFLLACYFVGMPEIFGTIDDLVGDSPVVRISVAAFSLFIIIPLILIMIPLSVLKAIPVRWSGVGMLVRLLNINIFIAAAFLILGVPLLTFAQYQYMPRLGYSKCNELRGHPTLWFNDWVKNPEWCVRGKDRAWVLEQAQKR
ncbi:hypothetical protein [Acidovorax sp. NCPPB 4044]|uniref:hypothetical protein n=1 Tax=Acidovorax sp. NCPPB 4044 TaxID=2940490 RepID=UPI002304BCD7|nr:hypothetical protein [Acidovorax sp. NCPPB 4044]MDA8522858.1 hypothetical protein [Acidovorax sp. NCPPB 4044]